MKKIEINENITVGEMFDGIDESQTLAELQHYKAHLDYFTDKEKMGQAIGSMRGNNLKDIRGAYYEREFVLKDNEGLLEGAKRRFKKKLEETINKIDSMEHPTKDEIKTELKKFRDGLKKKSIFVPGYVWEPYHDYTESLDERFSEPVAS